MTAQTIAVAAILALGGAGAADAATTDKGAVRKGAKYITKRPLSAFSYGFKADAINALYAARKFGSGTRPSQISRFADAFEDEVAAYATTAGASGKAALAAVTSGRNPRCYGSASGGRVDLVSIINSFYDGKGKYGNNAYDQAFAMLGLAAAHERIPPAAVKYLKGRRGKRGWGYSLSTGIGDDVQSTAIVIEALRAAGVKRSDGALQSAYKWITFQRNAEGGYNHEGNGAETNANATAMVIRAADALGKRNGHAKRALRALQKPNGSFRLTPAVDAPSPVLSTNESVLALAGRHYPVVKRKRPANSCF